MATNSHPLERDLIDGLQTLIQVLERRAISYAIIGGLAAGYRGRPRFTRDIDLRLNVPQLELPGVLADLNESGFRFETAPTIKQWTEGHMATLAFQGVRVDWLKPVLPAFQHVLDSAETVDWNGRPTRIATVEGLILMKLIAFRTQDQLDIENLLTANRGRVNLAWIRQEWLTLGGEDHPTWKRFQEMVQEWPP